MTSFLPYGRQTVDEADVAAVVDVLRGDWLTTGPAIEAFETDFAAATGAVHAVACANGTAALHLAALALGLGPDDRVVVPAVTFLATANAARYVGAEVVFADVDPDTGLMTPDMLSAALDRADGTVRAVFPVHLAGQCEDIDALGKIAADVGAVMVEDACHGIGGRDRAGRRVGSCAIGAMATFSLHPVKTIAAGEGGVVTTNDDDIATMLRRLRNHGMVRSDFRVLDQAFDPAGQPNPWYYEMPEPGFNYRMSDIHAALARSQLSKLDAFVDRRRALVELYDSLMAPLAPAIRPSARTEGATAWHLYVALIDFKALGIDRATVMRRLADQDVGTQVHYLPLNRQPYYIDRYGTQSMPGADGWYDRALSLPLFPAMADADVHRVVSALHKACFGGDAEL